MSTLVALIWECTVQVTTWMCDVVSHLFPIVTTDVLKVSGVRPAACKPYFPAPWENAQKLLQRVD